MSCALDLRHSKLRIALFEKYPYPRHKVCGEYISNEILPYLRSLGADPFGQGAVAIDTFRMTDPRSGELEARLPLGGFGISRYKLDHHLYTLLKSDVDVYFEQIQDITRDNQRFLVTSANGQQLESDLVVGAYGKRSTLDKQLGRPFIQKQSPWLGIKAHYDYEHPENRVDLHHFKGGYCGLSQVEDRRVNACFLVNYATFKPYGQVELFQEEVMSQNQELKEFFEQATSLFDKPMSIAQISFQSKEAVYYGIPMIGDAAGLIHPLCGNGMAMAIHSAKILADLIKHNLRGEQLCASYVQAWKENFAQRLRAGRYLQYLLINPQTNRLAFSLARKLPGLVPKVVQKTHGEVLI